MMAAPGSLAASCAAGHLRQQLKRALGRAEVGETEAHVRRDDADQRDRAESRAPSRSSACRRARRARRAANRARMRLSAPRCRIVSRSTRPDACAPETARSTSASTRSVPKPICSRYGAAHFWHVVGTRHRVVAVVAARAADAVPRRGPSATRCSCGHSSVVGALPAEDRGGDSRGGSAAPAPARRARRAARRSPRPGRG